MLKQEEIEQFEAGLKAENDGNSVWTQVSKEGNIWERQVLYDTEVIFLFSLKDEDGHEPWIVSYYRSNPLSLQEGSLYRFFDEDDNLYNDVFSVNSECQYTG